MTRNQEISNPVPETETDTATKRGRPALVVRDVDPLPEVDPATELYVQELRAGAKNLHVMEAEKTIHLSELTGMITAFQFSETVSRVAMLKKMQEIKEGKLYKDCPIRDRKTNELVQVNTWEDFCVTCGYSKSKVEEDLQNLALFGGNFIECQEALGIGYRELRRLRSGLKELSEDEREALIAKVKNSDDKEEFLTVIDELGSRNKALTSEKKELEKQISDKNELAKTRNEELDRLKLQVIAATTRTPEQARLNSQQKDLASCSAVDQCCQKVAGEFVALTTAAKLALEDDEAAMCSKNYVHERISALCCHVASMITEAGIDVDFATIVAPPLITLESFAETSPEA